MSLSHPPPPQKRCEVIQVPTCCWWSSSQAVNPTGCVAVGCALGKQGFPPSKQSKANSLCPPAPQAGHVPPEPPASLPWAALFPQGHRRSAGPAATGRHKSPMYAWAGGCVCGGCPSNFGVRRFHLPTSRVCVCVCVPAPPRPGWVCSGAQWPLRPHCGRTKPRDTRPREGTAAAQTSPAPPPPPLLSCEGARCGRLSPAGTALPAPGEREKGRGRA